MGAIGRAGKGEPKDFPGNRGDAVMVDETSELGDIRERGDILNASPAARSTLRFTAKRVLSPDVLSSSLLSLSCCGVASKRNVSEHCTKAFAALVRGDANFAISRRFFSFRFSCFQARLSSSRLCSRRMRFELDSFSLWLRFLLSPSESFLLSPFRSSSLSLLSESLACMHFHKSDILGPDRGALDGKMMRNNF